MMDDRGAAQRSPLLGQGSGPIEVPDAAREPQRRIRVLSIDDDPMWMRVLSRTLATGDIAVESIEDPAAGIARALADDQFDAILLDMSLPGMTGLEVLRALRDRGITAAVIMLTSDGTASSAAECLRAGAFHYLTKPSRLEELIAAVESASHQTALRRRVRQLEQDVQIAEYGPLLVGRSTAMEQVQAAVTRLARTGVSVLVQGESGTGKELAARALHDLGPRRDRPFVAVNCSAIPETLIDSELFGYSRGAFTGAAENRQGLFAQADGGTLFLDEIGDMPLAVQSRLLRALQEGEVRPLGASATKSVDVRVIAATHVDLHKAVDERRFRQDLFFRFNVVTLWLPPLRDRMADLPLLVAHFLRKHGGAQRVELSPAALDVMMGYSWPGNVRELQNAVLHAIALGGGGVIDVEALPARVRGLTDRRDPSGTSGTFALPSPSGGVDSDDEALSFTDAKRVAVNQFERTYLERVLKRSRGNVSEGARQAGLDRANFRRLLQRHGLDPAKYRG